MKKGDQGRRHNPTPAQDLQSKGGQAGQLNRAKMTNATRPHSIKESTDRQLVKERTEGWTGMGAARDTKKCDAKDSMASWLQEAV